MSTLHPDSLVIGAGYNWKHQPERLIYVGPEVSNGDDGLSKAMVWLEEGHPAVSGYIDIKDVELWERPAEPN